MTFESRLQIATRTLARGVVTTYGYDSATGELLSQTYSDDTAPVGYTYGRTGQVETVSDDTGIRDLVYDPDKPWRLTAEAEDAFYGRRVLTRLYDNDTIKGRVTGFQLGPTAGSGAELEQTFGFTTVGRFESITTKRDANTEQRTFRYTYRTDSALIAALTIDGNSDFGVARNYEDHRNLVTALDTTWGETSVSRYDYAYNELAQRTSTLQSGSAFADYGDSTFHLYNYDGRGEVTADAGYLGANVTDQSKQLPGRQHGFGYDNAGNRAWSDRTGLDADHDGLPDLRDTYTTNALNQYTNRDNNTLPVSGTAAPESAPPGGAGGTAVAIAGRTAPAGRQGSYWDDQITVSNTLHPWRGPVTIFTAKRGTGGSPDTYRIDTRMAQIAAMLQSFTYDDDGNLLSDGLADYQWDAENRLIRMETTANAVSWGFPHKLLQFRYDYLGRRVEKKLSDLDTDPATEVYTHRYLYDGCNVIAEYSVSGPSSLVLGRSYTWGLDIASSLTDAGGVGALLQITDHPTGKSYLPTYDGNGNIVSLINADSGALAAIYEYGPFGEPLRAETRDPVIADNPFRFSTKWTDLETGLVYYGRRYYSPSLGRFINRDPSEEQGGNNLYAFVLNGPVNGWDVLGQWPQWVVSVAATLSTIFYGAGDSSVSTSSWTGESGHYEDDPSMPVHGNASTDPFENIERYSDPNAITGTVTKTDASGQTSTVQLTGLTQNDAQAVTAAYGASNVPNAFSGLTLALPTTTADAIGLVNAIAANKGASSDGQSPVNAVKSDGGAPTGASNDAAGSSYFDANGVLVTPQSSATPCIMCHGMTAGGQTGAVTQFMGLSAIPGSGANAQEGYSTLVTLSANAVFTFGPGIAGGVAELGATTTLYRAVSPVELTDINATGVLQNPAGIEVKYFSTTADGAASYARQTVGTGLYQGPYTIISTEAPTTLVTDPTLNVTVDRGIQTVVVPTESLPTLTKPVTLPATPVTLKASIGVASRGGG